MRLLIITQKVDREDPVLGFFCGWISKLSEKFEKILVICLEKGTHNLPENIEVFSLGKESGQNKIKYLFNFFRLAFFSHLDYAAVFVHMNQEYVLFGGILWRILGKKIFLWRNHKHGSFLTRVAVWLSNKVFCTSGFSFVAKYKKSMLMPVGIDMEKFRDEKKERLKKSMLFLSRISPIKRPGLLIEALKILKEKKEDFLCNFYGDSTPGDEDYFSSLKAKVKDYGLENQAIFYAGVPNYETPQIYNKHEIFVNLTPTGSFDKTILEAVACGCIPIIVNKSLSGDISEKIIVENDSANDIAERVIFWLDRGDEEKKEILVKLQKYVSEKHSLNALVEKLSGQIK